jgi:hypothetical protein
LQQTRHVRD